MRKGSIYFKCIFSLLFCFLVLNNLVSQIIISEIILKNDSLILELFNNSTKTIKVDSVTVEWDTVKFTKKTQEYTIQPFVLSLVEFELYDTIPELKKIHLTVNSDQDQFLTIFNGWIVNGESAGRYPNIDGDFIVYNKYQITPGSYNFNPGLLVKKASKTNFTPRDSNPNASLIYNNCYWIFGGWDYNEDSNTWSSKSNVWKSADGLDWTLVNDNPPFSHYSSFMVYNNKMMVFYNDTVFMSEDGISWDKHGMNIYYDNARYVIFKDKLCFFITKYMGESTDGINWTLKYTNIPSDEVVWLPAIVSSEDRLWMYGGLNFNPVWTSTDGLTWEKLLDQAPWSVRKWFNYCYFDNKMWMIAGNVQPYASYGEELIEQDDKEFGNLQDFWYSSDGINWDTLKIDTSYHYRHASFLWNDGNRVLISSGFGNVYVERMYNDVWELYSATISLNSAGYTKAQAICVNTPLMDITYEITGASGATVSGLPEGVSGSFNEGIYTINGTPSASGVFNYVITTTGTTIPMTAKGSITTYSYPIIPLISGEETKSQTLCINTPLLKTEYTTTDSAELIISGLPDGIVSSYEEEVLTINGNPSITGTFNYSISTTGICIQQTEGTIIVNPDAEIILTSEKSTEEQTLCINTPITNIVYSTKGTDGVILSDMPEGVIGEYAEGEYTIRGIPKEFGIFNFILTTTGICRQQTTTGILNVNPDVSLTLSSEKETDTQFLWLNSPLKNITYDVSNATGVTITGLPEGVFSSYIEGLITINGTPSSSGTYNFLITTLGNCYQPIAEGTIAVSNMMIFPNPNRGILNILINGKFSIRIFDRSGHQIFYNEYMNDYYVFEKDLSDLFKTDGVYYIIIVDIDSGQSFFQKIIVIL